MDEVKRISERVYIYHNTYMAYITPRTRTGKEYQVATLHLIAVDWDVAGVLVARRTADVGTA